MRDATLRGALTFLGFAIGVLAVIFFASEYVFRVSDWSKLVALSSLALSFSFLGVYVQGTIVGVPFFQGPRLGWLRPSVVLYLLALLAGIAAETVFLGIEAVPRPAKILVSLLVGIGIILWAARTQQTRTTPRASTPRRRRGSRG